MALLAIAVVALLIVGYVVYGRFIARTYALDDARVTPAVRLDDGVDFVPTPRFYLLGQHFSAIAAAGPIAGPILACQLFGWLPCVLWIVVGVVFIGAVHDFSALPSVRMARVVAEVVREHWPAGLARDDLSSAGSSVAFADITATTFVGTEEPGMAATSKGGGRRGRSTCCRVHGLVERLPAALPHVISCRPPARCGPARFRPLVGARTWGVILATASGHG